ncbi:DUF4296 domain-containing protein [Ferruginibacter sp.]
MMRKLIVLLCATFLFSCGNKSNIPGNVLKPAKMQLVLWDVLRADAFTFDYVTKDTTRKPEAESIKMQLQIFAVHKTSKEEFYRSYEFYKTRPDLLQPMLDSIISKATRDKFANTMGKPKDSDTSKLIK